MRPPCVVRRGASAFRGRSAGRRTRGASALAGIPRASRRPPPRAGHRPPAGVPRPTQVAARAGHRPPAGVPRPPAAHGASASRRRSAAHAGRRTRGTSAPRGRSAGRRTRGASALAGIPQASRRPPPRAGHRHPRAFRGQAGVPQPPAAHAGPRLPPPAPALTPPQRAFPASRLAASAPAWYTVRNPCTKEDATDDRFPALPASAPPHGHAAGVGAVDLRAVSAAGRDLAGHRAQRLCHLSRLVGRAGLLAQSFHLGRRGPAHRLQRPAGGVRPRGHAGRARLYGGDALRLVCQALRAELSYHRHL